MKAWIKYGIVTVIVYWVLFCLALLLVWGGGDFSDLWKILPVLILGIPTTFILMGPLESAIESLTAPVFIYAILGVIIQTIFYFLIGVFINWIVGKVKARK